MICPFCGHKNIPGTDECEKCQGNLASLDGVVPRTRIEKGLMSDPISRIASKAPVTISPSATILEGVRQMNAARVGCLLVTNRDRIEGIVTEKDVVLKGLGPRRDLSKTPVAAIMTTKTETLPEDATLAHAVNRMAVGGFRHIPVLKNGKPVGVISIRDVLKYLSKLFP